MTGSAERDIQSRIRIEISKTGARLFRNNVGLLYTKDGRPVRVGLCPGSSDLIGYKSITITSEMVGSTVAIFSAIEVKRPGKKASEKQQHFIDTVLNAGGFAGVATCDQEAADLLEPLVL